jgi:ankyrin repeat protein
MQSENESKWAVVLGSPREGAACRELLQSGFDPNSRLGSEKTTPLMQAAGRGQLDTCKTLIRAGADVKLGDPQNRTALHFAAANGHDDVCQLLLECGADVDVMTNNDGGTPLHWAGGRAAAARVLLAAGASLHLRTKYDLVALHEAVLSRDEEVCRLLLEAGADPVAGSTKGQPDYHSPLDRAVSMGSGAITRILSEGRDIDFFQPNAAGVTLFDLADPAGDEDLVAFLSELAAQRTARSICEAFDEPQLGGEATSASRSSFSPI